MDPSQLRNLSFLMSFGGLLAACPGTTGDTDSSTGTGNTTTGTAGTTTGSGTTTQQPTEGGMTASESGTTSDPTTGAVTTSTTTTGVGTTDPGTTDPGTTGEPPPEVPVCADFGEKFETCYPMYARYAEEYVLYCNELFGVGAGDGAGCTDAIDEFFVCLNGVDCQSFGMELDMPVQCAKQEQAVLGACPSLEP